MGLQAVINALHRKNGMRVDCLEDSGESTQLEVWKGSHYDQHFEIYPPQGVALIFENISKSKRYAEMTFQALPRNHYAKSLCEILEHYIQRKEEETFYFAKYSADTRSLCRFIEKYFSFLTNAPDDQGKDSF